MASVILYDITKFKADCIVNAANNTLLGGGGVDGAIHRAAGPKLYQECLKLNGCDTGKAKITKGYNLPCKYIIHTVGPVYSLNKKDDSIRLLKECYKNTLDLAKKNNIKSIAFPCISTGVYGFPKDLACKCALKAIKEWKKDNAQYNIDITFCCVSIENFNLYNNNIKEENFI